MAMASGLPVMPLFIFDPDILEPLEDRDDRRLSLIMDALMRMQEDLGRRNSALYVIHARPAQAWEWLTRSLDIREVFCTEDYEPYARRRDDHISEGLCRQGIAFHAVKDQVVFGPAEVLKPDGKPYTVFTPYSRRWKERLASDPGAISPLPDPAGPFLSFITRLPSLEEIGFRASAYETGSFPPVSDLISGYADHRDRPDLAGTSRIGALLRFGTIPVREAVSLALGLSETWLNELIWREFFMQVMWHFPHVTEGAFRSEYDALPWINDPGDMKRWMEGTTGFPIVDAGMRELLATGFMHNRVRMIVASFLSKHLLIDWRIGEAWFARHLLDYELASNNGNWQWAAGTGCDAAPYFRIFNPWTQQQKFDPHSDYIRRWVPEFGRSGYPRPMLDHAQARVRCLTAYGSISRKTRP